MQARKNPANCEFKFLSGFLPTIIQELKLGPAARTVNTYEKNPTNFSHPKNGTYGQAVKRCTLRTCPAKSKTKTMMAT